MADAIITWDVFLDELADLEDEAKAEIIKFVKDTTKSSNQFLKRQGKKLIMYIEQRAAGKITKKEFESLVEDLHALAVVHALGLSAAAKKKVQLFVDKLARLVLKALVAAI